MKKEILKLTGLTEDQFYKMYPTEAAFKAAYPNFKLGGTPEAFPQIATADNFFSYGVPVPPTIHAYGGPVYPQIQTEAQFFSPVYSNSNNAYAVGGSYMEVHPEAKRYPEGPVGGSAFYMMQDGGSSMQEPTKDQTFYTQKMNDFFEKLRQASYKNLMNGIMNSEPDTTSATPELSMGRRGGMLSYQSDTSTGQTTTPAAASTTTTTQQPNFQMVTGADGQSYLVGPNNQLYTPYRGNQTTTTSNQQQERVNYYPYKNSRGVYVGTGLDNVANWLIPNNPRQRYRNIREQQGKGITDLTEEEIKALQAGTANIAEIIPEFRKTIFPWRVDNKLKSLNVKFRTPAPGQAATTTQQDPNAATTTTPGTNTTSTASSAATPGTATNPATTTTTNPAASATNQAATSTQSTTSAAPAASAAQSATSTTAAAPAAKSTQDDVNAAVAQMQAEARAKAMDTASSGPSIDPNTGEPEMPSAIAARIEKEQKEAERKNLENYEKVKQMQIRQGKTPDAYDPNINYDYGSKAASAQGTVDYTSPSQNSASSKAQTTTATRQVPSNTNSQDDAATRQKKAGYIDPSRYVNQDYIDAMTGQTTTQSAASTDPNNYIQFYPERYQETFSGSPIKTPVGPVETTYRLGGPYVLPMYQGMVGPSQVDEEAFGPYAGGLGEAPQEPMDPSLSPYGPYADGYRFEPEQDEFEIGLDFGRTKKEANPYLPGGIRGFADLKEGFDDENIAARHIGQMSRANQVFGISGQNRGDYEKNTGRFRLDQLVPVGYTGAGYKEGPAITQYGGPIMFDVADLFFLTPQMLESTRGRR